MNYVDYIECMLAAAATVGPERRKVAAVIEAALERHVGDWRQHLRNAPEDEVLIVMHQAERMLFPEFFHLLERLSECDDPPADALMRALELAPPRFRSAATEVVAAALPPPSRCDDAGRPLYALTDIAGALDADVADLMASADELGITPHAGAVHALQ